MSADLITKGMISAEGNYRFVKVTVWPEPGGPADPLEFAFTAERAIALAMNLLSAAHSVKNQELIDASAGDCETCWNMRMVVTERFGRVHCPACRSGDKKPPTFPAMSAIVEQLR